MSSGLFLYQVAFIVGLAPLVHFLSHKTHIIFFIYIYISIFIFIFFFSYTRKYRTPHRIFSCIQALNGKNSTNQLQNTVLVVSPERLLATARLVRHSLG